LTIVGESGTFRSMTPFRVDPTELFDLARDIERIEPFADLAEYAGRISVPTTPSAASAAIERFTSRLERSLADLAAATGSLGQATRSAAEGYREVEASISRRAGG
jgi:hypothetical protein